MKSSCPLSRYIFSKNAAIIKHAFYLLAILFSITNSNAQGTFQNTYSAGNATGLMWSDGIKLTNGHYCMYGYTTHYDTLSATTYKLLALQTIDASGNILATAETKYLIGSWSYPQAYSALPLTGGGFAITGQCNSQGFIARYDAALNLQWAHQYNIDGETSHIVSVAATPQNGFIALMEHGDGTGTSNAVIKTDSTGNIIWEKGWYADGQETYFSDEAEMQIKIAPDGDYLFLNVVDGTTFILNKTDTAGNIIWQNQYQGGTIIGNCRFLISNSGYIYIASAPYGDQPEIVVVDNIGNPAWWTGNDAGNPYAFWSTKSIDLDALGNITVGGQIHFTATNPATDYPAMYSVNSSGNLLQFLSYHTSVQSYANAFINTGNGFIMPGYYIDSAATTHTFISNLNSSLQSCSATDTISANAAGLVFTESAFYTDVYDPAVYATDATNSFVNNLSVTSSSICNTTLPVMLSSFTAVLQRGVVALQWKTAQEENLSYYTVERSASAAGVFTPINKVQARNLLTPQTYNTADENPVAGISYYRLRSTDADGKTAFSKVVPVLITGIRKVIISPDPIADAIHIHINAATAEQLTLQVTDMAGRIIISKKETISAGASTIVLPATFSKGMYLLKAVEKGKEQAIKFVK